MLSVGKRQKKKRSLWRRRLRQRHDRMKDRERNRVERVSTEKHWCKHSKVETMCKTVLGLMLFIISLFFYQHKQKQILIYCMNEIALVIWKTIFLPSKPWQMFECVSTTNCFFSIKPPLPWAEPFTILLLRKKKSLDVPFSFCNGIHVD